MKIAFQEMSKENEKTQMSIRREITSYTYTEHDDTKASKFPIPLGGIAIRNVIWPFNHSLHSVKRFQCSVCICV